MPQVFLKDYKPYDFTISNIDLRLDLDEKNTRITSTLSVKKQNPSFVGPLVLQGEELEIVAITLNETLLSTADYTVEEDKLTLHAPPSEDFKLTIITQINPTGNTELEGLYKSGDLLTTHCEPEGFRRITYYLDRPDILATFTTQIHADKTKYPVLLSNGNLVYAAIDKADPTKHVAIYRDPVPKPSYSFALVAGQLSLREDFFITRSGKRVALKIFVPAADLHKTEHALQTLKAAMHFDEEVYGREYDLEIYNIVGVPQFNSGATECKGLNIFHTAYLLADPAMATDGDYENISTTVAHEFFHNWRGNRVTIKNWFQLALKEGWATMTEQEFSQVSRKSIVPRIDNIEAMQDNQFPQDSSPLARSVLPAEYNATANVYTPTAYLKGAELLNMLRVLLGKEKFVLGCSIFFAENDGKAASVEDFLAAMSTASARDLSQFLLWYQQAGTPELEFEDHYDAETKTYKLTIKQSCPPTPSQPHKSPLLIPVAIGLLGSNGKDMPLQHPGEDESHGTTRILVLTEAQQTFTFIGVAEKPIPSLLRNFSAPVKISKSPVSNDALKFLLKHESDPVNRWLAGRTIAIQAIHSIIHDMQAGKIPTLDPDIIEAYRAILLDSTIEPQLKCEMLTFPSAESFMETVIPADPDLLFQAHEFFIQGFVNACYNELKGTYLTLTGMSISPLYSPEAAAIRALKNQCLSYLMKTPTAEVTDFCNRQLAVAANMTDTLGALKPLATYHSEERSKMRQMALEKFGHTWQHDESVLYHLFKLYALSEAPDALDQIIELMKSPLFKRHNPDHIWYLLYRFCMLNPLRFHEPSGRAYRFIADFIIEIDTINPTSAAYLSQGFASWKKIEPIRQAKMLEQLFRLNEMTTLSSNVKEIVSESVREALEAKTVRHVLNPHTLFSYVGPAGAGGALVGEGEMTALLRP